jgi:hypothetical protein
MTDDRGRRVEPPNPAPARGLSIARGTTKKHQSQGGDLVGRVVSQRFPQATYLRSLLPGAAHAASVDSAARPRGPVVHRPRGEICSECGTQSLKHVHGGRCDDRRACDGRAEEWRAWLTP